jgi:hypothetical protein
VRQVHSDGVMGRSGGFQPTTYNRPIAGGNDGSVTLKVMSNLNVIIWDEQTKARKVVPM